MYVLALALGMLLAGFGYIALALTVLYCLYYLIFNIIFKD